MTKITKNPQIKARETKLNKKSKEELIAIILKKDNTERNLNNQIKSLKGEINIFSTINKSINDRLSNAVAEFETYKTNVRARIIGYNEEIDRCNMIINKLKNDKQRTNKIGLTIAFSAAVIGFFIGILC